MKVCSKCKQEKDEGGFHKDKSKKDGLFSSCRECEKRFHAANESGIKERNKKYREENKTKIKEGQKKWREENKEILKQKKKHYRENYQDKIKESRKKYKEKHPGRIRDQEIRKKYGITLQQKDQMCDRQNGCCIICGIKSKLVIDHDHDTGRVRGLLCSCCNTGIGNLRESQNTLFNARIYLASNAAAEWLLAYKKEHPEELFVNSK